MFACTGMHGRGRGGGGNAARKMINAVGSRQLVAIGKDAMGVGAAEVGGITCS